MVGIKIRKKMWITTYNYVLYPRPELYTKEKIMIKYARLFNIVMFFVLGLQYLKYFFVVSVF